jgi:hypothetical protein
MLMKNRKTLLFFLLSASFVLLLSACSFSSQSAVQVRETQPVTRLSPTLTRSLAVQPETTEEAQPASVAALSPATDTLDSLPTPRPSLAPDAWKELPIVPEVSQRAREIYQRGLLLGNHPQRFSKVGDCQNVSSYFLGVFEQGDYELGPDYAHLQVTIDYYTDSFLRESYAVKGGYNVAAILTPMRADPKACRKNQSPLDCELADWQPSIALVSLEEWWADRPVDDYAAYLDRAVTIMIDNGTLPILATRAGNTPHVYALNDAIARVAYQHDVPLWNFWGAIQHLPNRGLTEDGFHLTFARNIFDDPARMKSAWPWRNLTALQVLDVVRRELTSP